MRAAILLVLGLATSCKGTSDAPRCGPATARGVDLTIARRRGSSAPAMTPQEAEMQIKLKAALEKVCVETRWSADVLACFQRAPDMAACKEQLTPAQRAAYMQATASVVGDGGLVGKRVRPIPAAGSAAEAVARSEAAVRELAEAARRADAAVSALEQEATELARRTDDAMAKIGDATTAEARSEATAALAHLKEQTAELDKRIAEAKQKAARIQRSGNSNQEGHN